MEDDNMLHFIEADDVVGAAHRMYCEGLQKSDTTRKRRAQELPTLISDVFNQHTSHQRAPPTTTVLGVYLPIFMCNESSVRASIKRFAYTMNRVVQW
jgi:hypothetical protein